MRRLKWIIANFLMLPLASHAAAVQKPGERAPTIVEILNTQAELSDAAGIHEYSQHLVRLLVGDNAGAGFIAALSDRLARAETMARHGKRKLITEADIASSFDDLMRQLGAPDSLKTDEAMVRKFRVNLLGTLRVSALISVGSNGTYCNPGEAVFLMFMLVTNNGSFDDRLPAGIKPEDLPRVIVTAHPPTEANANRLLSVYVSQHSRSDTVKLFNGIAQAFGF